MDLTLLAVLGVLVVVAVSVVSPRFGIAAPLSLVVVGVLLSYVPGVPRVEIEPEVILAGVLPPLLYAASVNMPVIDFRRDLKSIGGLSVVLVVASASLMGWLVPLVVPGIGFAEAFALGAIVSPTDAVATSIVRRTGVAPRLATMLDGESLLNDATALVLLRSAVAATGASVSVWHVGLDFLRAVVVAVLVGVLVSALSLAVRALVNDATVATALSFVVPFLAYAPAEHFDGSGLVAVVVAGLAIGSRGLVELRPEDRLSERVNWSTIAFLLEGGVFLVMGLELRPLMGDFAESGESGWRVAAVVALALAILWVSRSAYVVFLLLGLRSDRRQAAAKRPRLASIREFLASDHAQKMSEQRRRRATQMVERREADLTFYEEQRLGRRDGVVLVWAGMRGCITVAAAQTLPAGIAQRELLVLAAFCVAGASLLLQGGTLAWVVRRLGAEADRTDIQREQVKALTQALADVSVARCDDVLAEGLDGHDVDPEIVRHVRGRATPGAEWSWAGDEGPERERKLRDFAALRRTVLDDQREALLDLRAVGHYDSAVLDRMLDRLDMLELMSGPRGRA